ncbi:MAG: hypothetical protein QM482_09125 [Sulfurospirillum sp.]
MRVKLIIFTLPYDPFFSKVILDDYSFFYVPNGYTSDDIYSIVEEHNKKKRFIRVSFPQKYKWGLRKKSDFLNFNHKSNKGKICVF